MTNKVLAITDISDQVVTKNLSFGGSQRLRDHARADDIGHPNMDIWYAINLISRFKLSARLF